MVKTTIKLCKKFFLHKSNKNVQRKPGLKCLVYSRVDVIHARFQIFVTS